MNRNYTVYVENVGKVFDEPNLEDAQDAYYAWVQISKSGRGRAAGESVTLCNPAGDIMTEHVGTLRVEAMLDEMPLVQALWWYMENVGADTSAWASTIFFHLRSRVRTESWT